METRVKVVLEDGVSLPVYATEGSSGFDIKAIGIAKMYKDDKEIDLSTMTSFLKNAETNGYFKLRVGERVLLKTGVKVQLEPGTELQIRSRSGSSLKKGLVVTNSPGTIDSDYRGEVMIAVTNTTGYLATIVFNEAIAQGVIAPYLKGTFEVVEKLEDTSRGEGGFGHTNNK